MYISYMWNLFKSEPFDPLRRQIGKHKVLTSPEQLVLYSADATQFRGMPSTVVLVECEDDVVATLAFARTNGYPVIPRGAGSGLSGGSVPVGQGIVISFEKMRRIIQIDTEQSIAIVEPGVVTSDLQKEVKKLGLFYPPDPSSYTVSTIGGNVAENAGGLRCFKYGVTGHYILGLEGYCYDGSKVQTGIFASKFELPDTTALLVGSEGTLAVITKIALRLIPHPETTATIAGYFQQADHAFEMIEEILANRWVPSVMEYIDKLALTASAGHSHRTFPEEAGAMLLIEVDGSRVEVESLTRKIVSLSGKYALATETAKTDKDRDTLWELRRAISPSLIRLASGKIHEDIAVPRGNLRQLVAEINNISTKTGLRIAMYGHSGDGNLHIVILYEVTDIRQSKLARETAKDIFRLAIQLDGTITGEHGIGLAKRDILSWQFSPVELNLLKQIKQLYDADNKLNTSKVIN